MHRTRRVVLAIVLCALLVGGGGAAARGEDASREDADRLYDAKNYAEAANLYFMLLQGAEDDDLIHHANQRLVLCRLRLQLFDDALEAAAGYVARTKDTPWEARAERLAGNLWLSVPHWGTRAGGEFHRAQWQQGIQVRSYRHDKGEALAHLQRARDLYAHWDQPEQAEALVAVLDEQDAREAWRKERIEAVFDLAGACARFGIYEQSLSFWWWYWGERDDQAAETAGEEDFEEYHGDWQLGRKRPIGLRVSPSGDPVFPSAPDAWSDDLDDDRKILWLFREIRDLDPTEQKRYAARSYYRQAMLARSRFGMDRMTQYAAHYWTDEGFPLKEELEPYLPWELEDSDSLVLVGGRIRTVTLPSQWDVFALLRTVVGDYGASGEAPKAQYAIGLYHQSRQQYIEAKAEYAKGPEGPWADRAKNQVAKIEAPQVRINQTGVQLPGEPARLSVSHRNTDKLHFVARKIDLEGFFREIREQEFDIHKGPRDLWALGQWSQWFTHGYSDEQYARQVAKRHVKEEVARWSDAVENDGSHRYTQSTLQTPIDLGGAYLVYAYLEAPPVKDEKTPGDPLKLGHSRAVVVLTDLALVEKNAKGGRLYFVANARDGSPVGEATIEVAEFWSVWRPKEQKSDHYREFATIRTDENGLVLHTWPKRDHRGNLHLFVKAEAETGERIAWAGMRYWNWYNPSRFQNGLFAYCITDRPVYRPAQTVQFKAWVRRMNQGLFRESKGESFVVRIYDPRGTELYIKQLRTDEYGGLDGELELGEEPRLGVYRIHIQGENYAGGQNFRVEEYKKPEFEVTVEPGTTHAKLGQKLAAKVKATYYFGAPVTNAEVKYKVFREEYRHTYFAPGEWDWLYGSGYGWAWYDYEFFPWWRWVSCCRVAPSWWWSHLGAPMWGWGPKPVRELVQQGEGRIGEGGTLEVEIDTAAALRDHPDRDHRYVIQAEVRDASRRVITGEGAVKVTRQAFYAMVSPRRGWYRPGEEITAKIRCLTPDNEPVEAEGVVTVSEVVFGGPDNATYDKREIDRWPARTNERGEIEMRVRHERSGQLEIAFETPDQWGGVVKGYGLVWVCGRDFEGRFHRFNDLEIVTDKRTYQPGEVAHLMINTKRAGSHVLFADEVDNGTLLSWRLLHLPGRSTVVDVPVEKGDGPNFFIEALTVSNTRLHQQTRRICVPPVDGVMEVQVSADKAEYQPGETATVSVTATDRDGEPVDAQLTISAFDRSVLYIQPEYTPQIAKHFHGHMRHHAAVGMNNLVEQFAAFGNVHRPFQDLYPLPPSWWGPWGPSVSDWSAFTDQTMDVFLGLETVDGMDGNVVSFYGAEAASRSSRAAGEAVADACAPGAAPSLSGPAGGLREGGGGAGAGFAGKPGAPAGAALVEATVRKRFADTALWATTITTGDDGKAETTVEMPENLTTWKVNVWGMTKGAKVGQASTAVTTTKNLIVRLQAPRFFVEYDEVVLSANVHNYLETAKRARVTLEVPEELLSLIGDTPATTDVDVPAGGETRVDWRVKVVKEGRAAITVKALTDEESDAMQLAFPVLVHGMTKQVATTGSMRPDEHQKTLTVELTVPEKRRPELTRFEVSFAPSLVGAMIDALPYCLHYPYGCTEQTMSRFLPAVQTMKTLQNMGIKLSDVKDIRRGKMEEIRRVEAGERHAIWHGYWTSPIFDDAALEKIVQTGLQRIAKMQHDDGGWGWWSRDRSSPYLTSYVLHALLTAKDCDVGIDGSMIERGLSFLRNWTERELVDEDWSVSELQAFVAYVLALGGKRAAIQPEEKDERPGDLVERLWKGRDELNLYGKSLLSLAFASLKEKDKAEVVLQNLLQYLEQNEETQVAWLRTPSTGWWYWWNNDIETNAWALRALVRLRPKSDVAPRIAKWLLENRRNGYYWGSTRDTTLCVSALSDFVLASGEGTPDFTVRFDLDDGAVVKEVKVSKDNFFTYDNRFLVEGVTLGGGTHTLKITKTGPGALYFNTYLSYFTKEEHITATGHEMKVDRTYFHLKQIPYEVEVEGAEGQPVKEKRLRYERVPLKNGDRVESGDLIQVELRVTSDNSYTYLAFEDPKPAGCEAVQLRSGGEGQEGFWSYMELRDEKVAFFVNTIGQGEHLLRYRLRAEIPGIFHALPTRLFAMYAPKIKANSEEMLLEITDR